MHIQLNKICGLLLTALLLLCGLASAEQWKISFNGYPGTMELNRNGNEANGRFNLHGNWEQMLDLQIYGNAIFFRRAAADQKYLGVMEDNRMQGVFSQQGSGRYPWTAENLGTHEQTYLPGAAAVPPVASSNHETLNLALKKPARQSSTGYGGTADRAVDGNRDGNHNAGSVSHTNSAPNDWWEVDLGSVKQINEIRIWNRTDCCAERLSNFYVMVSQYPLPENNLQTVLDNQSIWKRHFPGAAGRETIVPVSAYGRYVRIQLAGQNWLSLAEVEVLGSETQPVSTTDSPNILSPPLSTVDEKLLLKLESLGAVYNTPSKRPVLTLDSPTMITKLWTYHWNNGKGATAGMIGLRDMVSGRITGTWKAVGTYHMFDAKPGAQWPQQGDGPPDLYWAARPNEIIPAGKYEVFDSDPITWSTNAELGNQGVAWVYGFPASSGQTSGYMPTSPPEHHDGGIPVAIYWHMADDADLYLNGKPLREYNPSFKTRGDEAPKPAFSATAYLKNNDIFTVGGRRGGSYGLMLIAVDNQNRVVFKSDRNGWYVYEPGERLDWFKPAVALQSEKRPVSVQNDPWYPQKTLNSKYNNTALSIWSEPDKRFAYLFGIVWLAH